MCITLFVSILKKLHKLNKNIQIIWPFFSFMFYHLWVLLPDRADEALTSMGAAVFHGGFSTFVAIALLVTSDSYIFVTFFKVRLSTLLCRFIRYVKIFSSYRKRLFLKNSCVNGSSTAFSMLSNRTNTPKRF